MALRVDQAFFRQNANGFADDVARRIELFAELRLGGESSTRRITPLGNFSSQSAGQLQRLGNLHRESPNTLSLNDQVCFRDPLRRSARVVSVLM